MEIPHCPNPECPCFSAPPVTKWYIRYGFHPTKAFGTIQRYRCRCCGRTFSTQTFSIDYYSKMIIDYRSLIEQLATCSGMNDISRMMRVRVETIENRLERLARCVQMIHQDLLSLLPLEEDLAADGFESFSSSQYFPNHVNIIAGKESEFLYSLGFANLRRKGRMTEEQKQKRAVLEAAGKASPKAVEKSMCRLFQDLTQRIILKGIKRKVLYTDEHKAYPRAFRSIAGFYDLFIHIPISSKDLGRRSVDLFPVDYIDRQFRKDLSDHVRETVRFAKCPSAMMSRLAVYRFFHNCLIPRRIHESRKGNNETHAERAGISGDRLKAVIERYWGHRVFYHKAALGKEEVNTWLCGWRNPGIAYGRYIPKYISV